MKEIQLTQGKVALVDDEDFERVNQFKWYAQRGDSTFYAARTILINGKCTTQLLHQFILGDSLSKSDIDHKDRNGLNNWRFNLRPCSSQENAMNRGSKRNSSSKHKGVYWDKPTGKWRAQITIGGRRIHLGLFKAEDDAGRAYDKMAIMYHGDFKRLNFPE